MSLCGCVPYLCSRFVLEPHCIEHWPVSFLKSNLNKLIARNKFHKHGSQLSVTSTTLSALLWQSPRPPPVTNHPQPLALWKLWWWQVTQVYTIYTQKADIYRKRNCCHGGNQYAKHIPTSLKSTSAMFRCSSPRLLEWQEHRVGMGNITSLLQLDRDWALQRMWMISKKSYFLSLWCYPFPSIIFQPFGKIQPMQRQCFWLYGDDTLWRSQYARNLLFLYSGNTRKPENVEYCHPPTRFPFSSLR